jgi:hypothetical protein
MTVLFEEPLKARTRPLGRIEPSVHFLTESTRPEAVAARRVVNSWYYEFPDQNGSFGRRLRSELDREHYQALDELSIHNLLRQHHHDVRYEEGGVGPDFRVNEDGRCLAALEVLSLFQRQDWTAEEKRHARLADALDAQLRPTAGYFVHFELQHAEREPSPVRFVEFVREGLDALPPHEQLVQSLTAIRPRDHLPSAIYEEHGVRALIEFVPMVPDAPSKTDPDARIVGMGPIIGGVVNSGERLKKKVKAKAGGRYDIEGVPFLVLAGIHDMFCSDNQVVTALYGGETVTFPSGEPGRRNDGLFGVDPHHPKGRQKRLSAVGVIRGLRWEAETVDFAILHNPYAATPWPRELLSAGRTFDVVTTADGFMTLDWL